MGEDESPALQVIVLLTDLAARVRAVAPSNPTLRPCWCAPSSRASPRGLVAVDAGVHLSAIARLIQEAFPSPPPTSLPYVLSKGPFAGLALPYATADANAAYVTRALVESYLITHPHLDHISGFVVNTAGLPGTRPKRLAGLPSTIQALKSHIFNNVIWPNLSDENNGAGLLKYLRLVDGGSPALGNGQGKGYLEICDGLLVKTWGISHGDCIERHSHRGSASGTSPRFGSHDASGQPTRRDTFSRRASQAGRQSLLSQATLASTPPQFCASGEQEKYCVYDSSAYFIQDHEHRREVLIFGDVEPDSISLSPRNLFVWHEAAPKIVAGTLRAIFIECSYDDSRCNNRLYGHLKPVFVIEELRVLAAEAEAVRKARSMESRKRKRESAETESPLQRRPQASVVEDPVLSKLVRPLFRHSEGTETPHLATPTDELSLGDLEPIVYKGPQKRPLQGLNIIIIHVKEMFENGSDPGKIILQQLQDHEREVRLGFEFVISKSGHSFYL